MFNHEPREYDCPFCALIGGLDNGVNAQSDIVFRSSNAAALIAPRWWPNNHGHVLVVPFGHHENLYDLPPEEGYSVHDLTREVAVALRASYGCEGISIRQNNEPEGHQSVWHYHVHVFPRYAHDGLYLSSPEADYASVDKRKEYAQRLRTYFNG